MIGGFTEVIRYVINLSISKVNNIAEYGKEDFNTLLL